MGSFIKKTEDSDIISMSEFINNRLFFVTYKNKIPEDSKTFHYFTANDAYSNDEHSDPISRVSLGTIAQFIKTLNAKLSRRKYTDKAIVNFSTGSERRRSNAAVLMGVYAITQLKMTMEEVVEKLSNHTTISPVDSLKAIKKAIALGFVNFDNFNTEDFYSLDDVKLNWVVPHKFLMFAGPIEASNGRYLSPRRYVAYFSHVGVLTIIRLCHIKYDANPFVDADIPHYDLNISGSIPSDKVLEVFMTLSEECRGVVLVHCREFLGRTGCLVGAYLVKHCGMTATEHIHTLDGPQVLEVFMTLSEECRGVVLVHCREFLGRAGCLVGAYLVKHCGMTATEHIHTLDGPQVLKVFMTLSKECRGMVLVHCREFLGCAGCLVGAYLVKHCGMTATEHIYTLDGPQVLEVFMTLSEECRGVVLVHCREFLGRAGCLVGAYLVKHCGMTATEAIAWVRLCTSECILEAQKTWLKGNEAALRKAGGEPLSEDPQQLRGICDSPEATDEIKEEVNDTPSSADDVTAQLENEVKVVNIVKSDSNMNKIENVA